MRDGPYNYLTLMLWICLVFAAALSVLAIVVNL